MNKGRISKLKAVLLEANVLTVFFAVAIIAFGVAYIWQVNEAATRGFAMRDLEREVKALQQDNDRMQMEVARLRSVASVSNRVQMLGLTKVQNIEYVSGGESVVALNR